MAAPTGVIRPIAIALLRDVALRGVLENVFTYDGGTRHELVFVFDAAF